MLSRKSLPQEVPKLMDNHMFWVETKLDGERLQMHVDTTRGDFRWFSRYLVAPRCPDSNTFLIVHFRKATDYTRMYGENKYSGSLTPYIYDCFTLRVKRYNFCCIACPRRSLTTGMLSLILDGEMRAFNTETEMFEPFGNLKTASNGLFIP